MPSRRSPSWGAAARSLALVLPLAAFAACGGDAGEAGTPAPPAGSADATASGRGRAETALDARAGRSPDAGAAASGGSQEDTAALDAAPRGAPLPAEEAGDGKSLFEERLPALTDWARENMRRVDPAADGWRSEVLAEAALRRLRELFTAAGGNGLPVDGSFEATSALVPGGLETVFDDGSTRVVRAADLRREPESGRDLAEELARYAGWRLEELEVAGILLEEDGAVATEATAVFSRLDQVPARQRNLRLGQRWAAAGGKDDLALRSLWLDSFEEASSEASRFVEQTSAVFGDHDFFDLEVMLGLDDHAMRVDRLLVESYLGMEGLAVGDLDGDGLEDLYLCQSAGLPNRMFLHQEDGTAQDVTPEWQLNFLNASRGALILDLDNDGLQDVAFAEGRYIMIVWNDERGPFLKRTLLFCDGEEEVYSISAADPDGDGDLDLYACRYVKGGINGGVPTPYHDAENGATNFYFVNLLAQGKARQFADGTSQFGFDQNNTRYSLASIWEDFDEDGDLDLYVTNDFGRNNLYRNDGGHFTDVADEMGAASDMAAGMGASVADVDLDGHLDLYVTNMYSEAGLRIVQQAERFMGGKHPELLPSYRRHARGNTLLLGRGGGPMVDASEESGAAAAGWAWGGRFTDFNGDGLEDLYVPNGFITSTSSEVPDLESFFWRRVVGQSPPGPNPTEDYRNAWATLQYLSLYRGAAWNGMERNRAFLNIGGGRFADVSALYRVDYVDDGRAVAMVDWDDDGREDMIVKNRTAPRLRLLLNRNAAPHGFLSIELVGTRDNRDAIGALVELELEGKRLKKRVYAGDGYLSQSSKRLLFGLDGAESVRRLTVRWPDGSTESFEDVAADERYRLVQGSGELARRERRPAPALQGRAPEVLRRRPSRAPRIVVADKLPMGPFAIPAFDGPHRKVADLEGRPVLLVAWSSDAEDSGRLLDELAAMGELLLESKLEVVPLTVDEGPALARARSRLKGHAFEAQAGYLDGRSRQALEIFLVEVLGFFDRIPLPASFLLDENGQLVTLYFGPRGLEQLEGDLVQLEKMNPDKSSPFIMSRGLWLGRPQRDLESLGQLLRSLGYEELSELYLSLPEKRK